MTPKMIQNTIQYAVLGLTIFLSGSKNATAQNLTDSSRGNSGRLRIIKGDELPHILDGDIAKRTVRVFAGQGMNLFCYSTAGTATDFTGSVDSGGKPIKDWHADGQKAYTDTNVDKNNSIVKFYWLKSGSGLLVKVYAKVNGKTLYTFAKFNVVRPAHNVTATPGALFARVRATDGYPPEDRPAGKMWGLGDLDAGRPPGMSFSASFPQGLGGGSIQWVQVIEKEQTSLEADGTVVVDPPIADSGLDNTYPYPSTSANGTQDSPQTILTYPSVSTVGSRIFKATMYLMWRPAQSGNNPIYIPLSKVGWGFYARAFENGPGTWVLDPASNVAGPTVAYTDEPPTWENAVKNK